MRQKQHTEKENFCLSPQIAAALKQLSERRGQTKSEIIRQLILQEAGIAPGAHENAGTN